MTFRERLWNASPRSLLEGIQRRLAGKPSWVTVRHGPLAGHQMWLAPLQGPAWKEMAEGVFDAGMFSALAGTAPTGGCFWDIGAHFGYHSLCFAALGGERGRVLAFEPNPFNRERLAFNLGRNPDLGRRIEVIPKAVASRDGEMEFIFSAEIENGMSSCSYLKEGLPPLELGEGNGFTRQKVATVAIDSFIRARNEPAPDVIKIDVEGGEQLVLEGGRDLLARYKPLLLMEVHNIQLMLHVQALLTDVGYRLELVDDPHSSDSRCFVLARPRTGR